MNAWKQRGVRSQQGDACGRRTERYCLTHLCRVPKSVGRIGRPPNSASATFPAATSRPTIPRPATSRTTTPRAATSCTTTPRPATSCTTTPRPATSRTMTRRAATSRTTTPRAAASNAMPAGRTSEPRRGDRPGVPGRETCGGHRRPMGWAHDRLASAWKNQAAARHRTAATNRPLDPSRNAAADRQRNGNPRAGSSRRGAMRAESA